MMQTNDAKREIQLVLRAQAGDREALDELLRCVQTPLFRYIQSLTGNRALAEDVLQEVFLSIYRKLGWLREPQLFRSWAYRIASREAFKQLRRARRWVDQSEDETAMADLTIPPRDTLDEGAAEALIAQASPASRAVIALHYLHEMSLAEIAAVLGIAEGTVKSRLAYGLSRLRAKARV